MEALKLYPQDRIFGLVIFVDPIFFATAGKADISAHLARATSQPQAPTQIHNSQIQLDTNKPKEQIYVSALFSSPAKQKRAISTCTSTMGSSATIFNPGDSLLDILEEIHGAIVNKNGQHTQTLTQKELDRAADGLLDSWVDKDGHIAKRQESLREKIRDKKQTAELIQLVKDSQTKRQLSYEKHTLHQKSRDDNTYKHRQAGSHKFERSQRYARKQRLYELDEQYDYREYMAM